LAFDLSSFPACDVAHVLPDASYECFGNLEIVCVPKGSMWAITISDVANPRVPCVGSHLDWV